MHTKEFTDDCELQDGVCINVGHDPAIAEHPNPPIVAANTLGLLPVDADMILAANSGIIERGDQLVIAPLDDDTTLSAQNSQFIVWIGHTGSIYVGAAWCALPGEKILGRVLTILRPS